jgi:hypothetical protein
MLQIPFLYQRYSSLKRLQVAREVRENQNPGGLERLG